MWTNSCFLIGGLTGLKESIEGHFEWLWSHANALVKRGYHNNSSIPCLFAVKLSGLESRMRRPKCVRDLAPGVPGQTCHAATRTIWASSDCRMFNPLYISSGNISRAISCSCTVSVDCDCIANNDCSKSRQRSHRSPHVGRHAVHRSKKWHIVHSF